MNDSAQKPPASEEAPRPVLPDPQRIVREQRAIIYEWEIASDGKDRRRLAVLTVQYCKKGIDYKTYKPHPNILFSYLRIEDEDLIAGLPTRTFGMTGMWVTSEEVTRYSRKRLETFAAATLQRVQEMYSEGNPKLSVYFDADAAAGARRPAAQTPRSTRKDHDV